MIWSGCHVYGNLYVRKLAHDTGKKPMALIEKQCDIRYSQYLKQLNKSNYLITNKTIISKQVALLQSRMEKRKKKQRRIRAVDDDDDRPQHAPRKSNKMKKKQSNFANDLTDTSRAATKRLRYDANKAQKDNRGPRKGKGPAKGKGPGKGKPNAKPKAFGKPQAAKGRRKNK